MALKIQINHMKGSGNILSRIKLQFDNVNIPSDDTNNTSKDDVTLTSIEAKLLQNEEPTPTNLHLRTYT